MFINTFSYYFIVYLEDIRKVIEYIRVFPVFASFFSSLLWDRNRFINKQNKNSKTHELEKENFILICNHWVEI